MRQNRVQGGQFVKNMIDAALYGAFSPRQKAAVFAAVFQIDGRHKRIDKMHAVRFQQSGKFAADMRKASRLYFDYRSVGGDGVANVRADTLFRFPAVFFCRRNFKSFMQRRLIIGIYHEYTIHLYKRNVKPAAVFVFFSHFCVDIAFFYVKMYKSGRKWIFVVISGMELVTGEYRNTLDEKGRILFPARLRTVLTENVLMITQGLDGCLWLYTPAEWKNFSEKLMEQTSPFNKDSRLVLRRLIAPAQEVEFDKAGRLSIPQSLREHAGLVKECVIMGVNKYMELWDAERYEHYIAETDTLFRQAAEGLNGIHL